MKTAAHIFFFMVLATLLGSQVHAQAMCDAALVEAMKTDFKDVQGASVVELVKQIACTANTNGTLIAIPLAGYTSQQVSQACSSNDSQFFSTHYKEISLSILPDAAFETLKDICVKNGLSLLTTSSGNQITLSAGWSGQNNIAFAKVTAVGWTDNIQTCLGPLAKKSHFSKPTLGTGGLTATCTRKDGDSGKGDAIFTIQTDRGMQLAKSYSRRHYELWGYYGDDLLKCAIDGNVVLTESRFPGLNAPPLDKIDIDAYLEKAGDHLLQCSDVDTGQFEGHPCWKYKYALVQDGKVIISAEDFSCHPGSPPQPPPLAPHHIIVR